MTTALSAKPSVLPEPVPERARAWRPELPGWAAGLLSAPMAISFAFLVAYPCIQLVVESFGRRGLGDYIEAFNDDVKIRALWTTLWVSGAVTVSCVAIAFVIAWSLRTSQSRLLKALLWFGILIPMAMSIVVQNYVWIVILGRNGLFNDLMRALGLPTVGLLYTPPAVVIGMIYTLLPFAVFPLLVTFRTIPDQVLHAAQSLGAGWTTVMKTVVLPLSVAGLFITFVLVFVLSLGFYVTPIILGGPRATFLAKVIQDDLLMRFDSSAAAASSVILMVIALGIVTVAVRAVGRERFERALG
jgi:mannopine transport system permease protein